jgi:4-amino-4-deoxy-L-arabinose transferase-like glycosyltransferase
MVFSRRRSCPGLQEGTVEQEDMPPGGRSQDIVPVHKSAWLEPIVILLLALTLNLAGNRETGLWDRDEPRYAVCVREMRARNDWIFPTFNGEPRYHKPILIYWLMGLTTALAGENPFGVRLVSGLAGAVTAVGVWWLGRRMLGPRGGFLSALIFATAPIVVAESKLATTDATLMLWLFGCQSCLWVLSRRPSRGASALFWVLLSLAILTKGPIGPALIGVSTLLSWWWGWPVPPRERLHWQRGLAGLLILTCPWFIAVSIASHGEFLRFAVGRQIVHRLATDMEAHGGFPGYYPVVSTLLYYPWSSLLPAAIIAGWSGRKANPNVSFLLGWVVGPLVLLECFQTKLIHYYLPAFPACSLLVAWLVLSLGEGKVRLRSQSFGRLGLACLVAIGLAWVALLLTGTVLMPRNLRSPLIAIAAIVVLGTLVGTRLLRQGASERAIYALATTWAFVLLLFGGWLIPMGERYRTSRVVGERLASHSNRLGLEPVLLEYQEPGVIYALGHPAALTRDRDGFFAHLEGGRSVLTVLLASEIEVMRRHFGLDVRPIDHVDGFALTKGKRQTLHLAAVRQADPERVEKVP